MQQLIVLCIECLCFFTRYEVVLLVCNNKRVGSGLSTCKLQSAFKYMHFEAGLIYGGIYGGTGNVTAYINGRC